METIINYHFQEGRQVFDLQIGNRNVTGFFGGLENLRYANDPTEGQGEPGNLETCFGENKVLWNNPNEQRNKRSILQTNDGDFEEHIDEAGRKRRHTTSEAQQTQIERKILEILTVPLIDFVTTEEWIMSNYRFINQQSIAFENAVHFVKMKFCMFLSRDYKYFYETRVSLPFCHFARSEHEFQEKYMTRITSLLYLRKLLIWHYAHASLDGEHKIIDYKWKIPVYKKVRDLMQFLDKKRGKKNCDYYLSPANAGKTLFLNLIKEYLINCGEMSNWNRASNFPLQTCGNVRSYFLE